MNAPTSARTAAFTMVGLLCAIAHAATPVSDPRLREVVYDPHEVITVPVKRGLVTHVLLDADEAIADVAAGLGGDCAKPEAAWCIAAQPSGRSLFVKAKSTANAANNVAVVTDKRSYSFAFVVLADGDTRTPVYRLAVTPPIVRKVVAAAPAPQERPISLLSMPRTDPAEVIAERLAAGPQITNTSYSIAEGTASDDIVPTLIFDDGRFTYLRFPGNREVPAVFHVLGDGSETLVNTRMEDDLLVVDRVSRRLVLRAGSAVVAVWNDAFDLDGSPPVAGVSVPGVGRSVKTGALTSSRARAGRAGEAP